MRQRKTCPCTNNQNLKLKLFTTHCCWSGIYSDLSCKGFSSLSSSQDNSSAVLKSRRACKLGGSSRANCWNKEWMRVLRSFYQWSWRARRTSATYRSKTGRFGICFWTCSNVDFEICSATPSEAPRGTLLGNLGSLGALPAFASLSLERLYPELSKAWCL